MDFLWIKKTLKVVKSVNNIQIFNSFKKIKHVRMLKTITTSNEHNKRIKDKNLKLIHGEYLYNHAIFDFQNKTYKGYDEMQICCKNDNWEIIIDFLTAESYKNLVKAKYTWVHLELMVFSIA